MHHYKKKEEYSHLKKLLSKKNYLKFLDQPLSKDDVRSLIRWSKDITPYLEEKKDVEEIVIRVLYLLNTLCLKYPENKQNIDSAFCQNAIFLDLIYDSSLDIMHKLDTKSLCLLGLYLTSFSTLPSSYWVYFWEKETLLRMNEFKDIDCKTSILAYIHMTKIYEKHWIEKWFDVSSTFLFSFSPNNLHAVCDALQKMEQIIPKRWGKNLEECILHSFDQISLKEVGYYFKFYSNFEEYNLQWIEKIYALLPEKISKCDRCDHLSKVLLSIGGLGVAPKKSLIDMLFMRYLSFSKYWTIESISVLLYGCALLEIDLQNDYPDLFIQINEFISQIKSEALLSTSVAFGLIISYQYYKKIKNIDLGLNQDHLFYIEKNLRSNLSFYISQKQKEVYTIYKDQYHVTEESWIPEIYSYVDLYREEDKTVIEIDGPHHFQNGQLNTKSLLKTKLLKAYGYQVFRIPVCV